MPDIPRHAGWEHECPTVVEAHFRDWDMEPLCWSWDAGFHLRGAESVPVEVILSTWGGDPDGDWDPESLFCEEGVFPPEVSGEPWIISPMVLSNADNCWLRPDGFFPRKVASRRGLLRTVLIAIEDNWPVGADADRVLAALAGAMVLTYRDRARAKELGMEATDLWRPHPKSLPHTRDPDKLMRFLDELAQEASPLMAQAGTSAGSGTLAGSVAGSAGAGS